MRFISVSVCQTETKMGTYTTNYNLFMPSVGEQGWGDLVNGNFSTIDATMKGLDTRIGAVEPLSIIYVDENHNVTFPGKIVATEFVGGVGNFEKCYLPISKTGNFAVGVVSMPTLSYYPGQLVLDGNSPVTFDLGVPALQTTIPTTLYSGIPDVGLNVSFYSPQSNVGTTTTVYQGETVLHTYSYGNASFNLKNLTENVRVVVTLPTRGTYNQAKQEIKLTKADTTFYLP